MEFLTRKYGPLPGWAWGGAAALAALLFWYFRKQSAGQQGQQGLPSVSPAASAVPFVPSVSVTGIPPTAQNATTNPYATTPGAPTPVWQFGFGFPKDRTKWVWRTTANAPSNIPNLAGQIFPASTSDPFTVLGPSAPAYSWQWAPVPAGYTDVTYAAALNGGGSGGFGYAGAQGYASPIGGWTVGWQPFGAGSGGPASVNRTGAPRTRRLFGGSGGGASTRTAIRSRGVRLRRQAGG